MIRKSLLILTSVMSVLTIAPNMVSAEEHTATFAVDVTHIRGTSGRLIMALYDNAQSYKAMNGKAAYATAAIRPIEGKAHVRFGMLPPGKYAVIVFHDGNNNGQFDFKGEMPQEGYGISGAKHALDEPSFRQAGVAVPVGEHQVSVKMHYFQQ